jgi:trimeric autotransporter adhesin
MKISLCIGRVGGLAIGLGTGAWLASVPWVAAADPDSSWLDLIGAAAPAAADPSGLNIDVSYDGMTLVHMGDATAHSADGGLAIAYGDGSTADAGTYTNPDGFVTTGTGDYAFADGADSTAIATGADYSSATASDGATADSGIAILPANDGAGLSVGPADYDSATATGAGSTAEAEGGNFDSATASGGGTADAGFLTSTTPGMAYNGGDGDSASASGAGSTAEAGLGNYNIADVFGNDSQGLAGGSGVAGLSGNDDLAGVFGNDLTANATGGSDLSQFATPLGDFAVPETAAAVVPTDDLGLTALLADLSSLGL